MSDMNDIHGLVDGYLEGAELSEAQARVNTCPVSRAEYDSTIALKRTLQKHCQGIHEEEVWKACQGRIAELDKTKTVEKHVGRFSWAICGVLACSIFSAHMYNRMNGSYRLKSGELSAGVLAPVNSSEQSMKDSLSRLVANPVGLQITSMSSGVVDGRRAYRWYVTDKRGPMVIDALEGIEVIEGRADGSGLYFGNVNGLNTVSWKKDGYGFTLVADRTEKEISNLVRRICGH